MYPEVDLPQCVRFFLFGGLAAFLCASTGPVRAADPPKKLNVLFIAVDDLNVKIGCYGAPVKTPNIDRLAAMGRRFDRAYCQFPLCNPSRSSLMSGWRAEHTQVWGNEVPPRPHLQGATMLQEYFHANGYYTAKGGKIYHETYDKEFEWDNSPRVETPATTRPAGEGRRRARAGNNPNQPAEGPTPHVVPISWQATDRPDAEEPDGRIARRLATMIAENKDRTFFIGAGFSKPHLPWICPRKYFDLYPPESIQLETEPPNAGADIPLIAWVEKHPRDPKTDEQRRQALAAYYACASFADAQIGVVLDALDREHLWDNTVVVLFGDHGWHLGEHGLWRKMSLFEESARAPLIIVAPGMPQAGVAAHGLVEFVDIYPTLVDLCGLPPVAGLEGTSLVRILRDPTASVKTAAFTSVSRGEKEKQLGKSVRTDRFRYTEWPDGSKELYDHESDPHEYTNLAKNPDHQKTMNELSQVLKSGYRAALSSSSK